MSHPQDMTATRTALQPGASGTAPTDYRITARSAPGARGSAAAAGSTIRVDATGAGRLPDCRDRPTSS